MTGRFTLRALGLAIGAMVLNVATAFLVVFIYSVAVAPGHDAGFYQAWAERAAPISGIVAGIPILFAAGRLIGRGRERTLATKAGLLVAFIYVAVDLAILLAAGGAIPWRLVLVSYLTKLAAAALGARFASRRPAD